MGHCILKREYQSNVTNGKSYFFAAVHNNIKMQQIEKKKNVPWLTSAIQRLFHKRKRLWKKAKSSQHSDDWDKYKKCRNHVKSELNKSFWHRTQSLLNNNNPKRFWSFIKSKTKSRSIPTEVSLIDQKASSSTDKAQLFNNFFASVFTVSPDIHDNDYDEQKCHLKSYML